MSEGISGNGGSAGGSPRQGQGRRRQIMSIETGQGPQALSQGRTVEDIQVQQAKPAFNGPTRAAGAVPRGGQQPSTAQFYGSQSSQGYVSPEEEQRKRRAQEAQSPSSAASGPFSDVDYSQGSGSRADTSGILDGASLSGVSVRRQGGRGGPSIGKGTSGIIGAAMLEDSNGDPTHSLTGENLGMFSDVISAASKLKNREAMGKQILNAPAFNTLAEAYPDSSKGMFVGAGKDSKGGYVIHATALGNFDIQKEPIEISLTFGTGANAKEYVWLMPQEQLYQVDQHGNRTGDPMDFEHAQKALQGKVSLPRNQDVIPQVAFGRSLDNSRSSPETQRHDVGQSAGLRQKTGSSRPTPPRQSSPAPQPKSPQRSSSAPRSAAPAQRSGAPKSAATPTGSGSRDKREDIERLKKMFGQEDRQRKAMQRALRKQLREMLGKQKVNLKKVNTELIVNFYEQIVKNVPGLQLKLNDIVKSTFDSSKQKLLDDLYKSTNPENEMPVSIPNINNANPNLAPELQHAIVNNLDKIQRVAEKATPETIDRLRNAIQDNSQQESQSPKGPAQAPNATGKPAPKAKPKSKSLGAFRGVGGASTGANATALPNSPNSQGHGKGAGPTA